MLDALQVAAGGLVRAATQLHAAAGRLIPNSTDAAEPSSTIATADQQEFATDPVSPAFSPDDWTLAAAELLRARSAYTASARVVSMVADLQGRLLDVLSDGRR